MANAASYFDAVAARSSSVTSSTLNTAGIRRGYGTTVSRRARSGRSRVTVKKKRRGETAPLMLGGCMPVPKTGLALYGSYCPPGLARPTLSSMIVRALGPPAMVADAAAWIDARRGIITNSGAEPFLYPHFSGCCRDQLLFYCDLLIRDQWCETIRDADLKRALALSLFEARLMAVIGLYMAGIETLKGRELQPDVVLLCLPQDVVDRCAVAPAAISTSRSLAARRGQPP